MNQEGPSDPLALLFSLVLKVEQTHLAELLSASMLHAVVKAF